MYKYFTEDELRCKCGCGVVGMDTDFMKILVAIREAVDQPFVVRSAYRCPSHNALVSKTGRTGPHTTGRAIDIRTNSGLRFEIMEAAIDRGITRIGIANSFIHIDDLSFDDGFTEDVIWTY